MFTDKPRYKLARFIGGLDFEVDSAVELERFGRWFLDKYFRNHENDL